MRHDLVLEGLAVVGGEVEEMQIGVSDGRIDAIRKSGLIGERKIRAEGCIIFPGFIDVHVHMREPGWEAKEDFRTGSMAAVHGGVTTVFDMPNNKVPATSPKALRRKASLARRKSLVDVFLFGGVEARNIAYLPSMKGYVVGYKVYLAETTGGLILPASMLGRALKKIGTTGRPASVHCEDQSVIDGARGRAIAPHAEVRPPAAETEAVRTTLASRGLTRVNLCHISTSGALRQIARAKARGGVACEATLHHLVFDERDGMRNPLLKTNPPLRSGADRARLVEGLRSGVVDFLVTDHAPHRLEEKGEGAAGVPGLDNYANVVSSLIAEQGFTPSQVAGFTSSKQARFFGLADRGEIATGARADLTVLDLRSKERVKADGLYTKCGWSPYEGMTFPGRARWTLVGGRVLLDDFQLAG